MENLRKEIRSNENIEKAMRKLNDEFHYNSFDRFVRNCEDMKKDVTINESEEIISYFGTREINVKDNVDIMFLIESMTSTITISFAKESNDVLFEEEFRYVHANSGKNGYTVRIVYHANTDTIERMS